MGVLGTPIPAYCVLISTQVAGERVTKGSARLLREGTEVIFPAVKGSHRFIFQSNLSSILEPHYDIHPNVLGWGSYAKVYRAICKQTNGDYAVKVISCEKGLLQSDSEQRQKLYREIDIMQDLRHPNIVRFQEHFLDKDADKICKC